MRMLMILAALPLVACGSVAMGGSRGDVIAATGTGGSRTFQTADFTSVELAGADNVDVRVGGGFSVRADGPAEELDKLEIRRDGANLWVGRKPGMRNERSSHAVTIHVTMPSMAAASVAGSGDMTVDKVSGGDFNGGIAGSGDLRLGMVSARSAKFAVAGSGVVSMSGHTDQLNIDIAGSGNFDAPQFRAARADISIAGSGNVTTQVNGPAKVAIMGSGDAILTGGAQCQSSKMGSGTVRCS